MVLVTSQREGNTLIKTGKLAQKAGILPSKIRYYVKEGLLNPADYTAGGYYLFDEQEALERIGQIGHLQVEERRTLSEIKSTLKGNS